MHSELKTISHSSDPHQANQSNFIALRKLVSCETHRQFCTKVDIEKIEKLRGVAKIKTHNYKIEPN